MGGINPVRKLEKRLLQRPESELSSQVAESVTKPGGEGLWGEVRQED